MIKTDSRTGALTIASIFFLATFTGCQAAYLIKSAYSQADLLRRRVPLEAALEDANLSAEHKRKLTLARDARLFAENELGLKQTQNYTTFVQLDGPYVTYVVSAAPKNELKHHLWRYPIVGSLPYKGYFDPDGAKEEGEELKKKNLDVFIRGVTAYSTLGWFRDPILSSMLDYKDHELVNTIIHETVHATIYIKSEADFNERLASFIGNKGTELFYSRHGRDSNDAVASTAAAVIEEMRDDAHDEKLFGEFISSELARLDTWYAERVGQVIPEDERRKRLAEIQTRFIAQVKPRLKRPGSFARFETAELNNARLLTYRLYLEDLSDFEKVFEKLGHDFTKMLAFAKDLERAEDPKAALAKAAQE